MESKEALLQCFPEAFDPGRGVCCGHPSWKRLLQASHTMAIIDQEYCIRLPVPSLAYQTGWTASHLIYQLQISRSIVSRGGRDLWFKCTNITVTNKTCVRAPFIRSDSSEPSRLHALVLSPFPITVLTTDGQRHCSRVPLTTDHISLVACPGFSHELFLIVAGPISIIDVFGGVEWTRERRIQLNWNNQV